MAPKMKKATCSDVVPTKEEEDAALAILASADKAKIHSVSCAMNHFLKSNPDPTAACAEGALRMKYLKHFLILQLRAKNTTKKMNSSREVVTGTSDFTDTMRWNRHKIQKEKGVFKGDLFMNILKAHPCSISGSTHEEAVEYDVPQAWNRFTSADMNRLKLESDADAKEADSKMMDEAVALGKPSSQSSGSHDPIPVKQEEKTPEEILANKKAELLERINNIRSAPDIHLRKYQDLKIDLTKIKGKTDSKKSESRYAAMVSKDAEKVIDAINLVNPVLEKMISRRVADEHIMKVAEGMDSLDAMNDDLQSWASKLGFKDATKLKRKRLPKDEAHAW